MHSLGYGIIFTRDEANPDLFLSIQQSFKASAGSSSKEDEQASDSACKGDE